MPMHDSFTPLGGLVPMWLIELGEVVFGGVGSGLYGMLIFAIMAVFIAGLMIGRTPEYIGKKIESFEMKMTSIVILVTPFLVLVGTAIAVMAEAGKGAGYSTPERMAFRRFSTPCRRWRTTTAAPSPASRPTRRSTTRCWRWPCGSGASPSSFRYWPSQDPWPRKSASSRPPAPCPTHGPLFVAMLVGTVVLVGALTYVPALALGPVVEHLQLYAIR